MDSKDKKQKTEEEKIKEEQENWKGISKVIKYLEKKGLEIKECNYGQGRSEYIRGKILEEHLTKNLDEVCKQINSVMKTKLKPDNPQKVLQEIYKIFKSVNLIKKACRQEGDKRKNIKVLLPYEELVLLYRCNCGKDHEKEELDHQKKLDLDELNKFDPSYCYVLNVHRGKSMIYVYLGLIIFLVLMYALLPVWPYRVKVIVWWISYVLLLILLGIYAIRIIVYLFFYIFGYNIWLLPDMDDNKLGFIDSFRRVISVEKRNEKWYTIIIRLCITLVVGYIAFVIYKNPSVLQEAKKLFIDAIKDMYSFGEDKIVNSWNTTAIALKNKKHTKSYDEIDNLI